MFVFGQRDECDGPCTKGPRVPRTETPQGLNSWEKPAIAASTTATTGVIDSAVNMTTSLPTRSNTHRGHRRS